MTLTNCRATVGLNARATPISTNSSGTVQVGANNAILSFADADVAYSMRAIFVSSGDSLVLDLTDSDTTGSTAFVAGTAQVETNTITAAGGCTSNGTMTLVVTAAGMTGSPKNVAVALTTTAHTTAALIAAAARAALTSDTAVSALYTVGGTGADITLTRKPTATYTVPGGTLNLYAANDATLNLAIPSGLGVTASATSTNTTAGVVSDGVKIYDAGTDFEGVAVPTITTINGLLIKNQGAAGVTITGSVTDVITEIQPGEYLLRANSESMIGTDPVLTIAATGAAGADVIITVIGATA